MNIMYQPCRKFQLTFKTQLFLTRGQRCLCNAINFLCYKVYGTYCDHIFLIFIYLNIYLFQAASVLLGIVLQTQKSIALNSITQSSIGRAARVEGGFVILLNLHFGDGADGWSVVLSLNYQVQSVSVVCTYADMCARGWGWGAGGLWVCVCVCISANYVSILHIHIIFKLCLFVF